MKKLNLLFIALVVLLACLFVCGCHDQTDDPTAPIYTSDDSNGYIDSPADTSDEVSSSTPSATTPSVVNKSPLNAKITYAGEFQDGYAFVSFRQGQTDYGAIIDIAGVIQFRKEIQTIGEAHDVVENWLYMGDHVYAISYLKGAHSEYAIMDVSGNILASSENGDFDLIVTVGDGLAIVYKKVLSGIEYTHCYAAFDKSGKIVGSWVEGYEFENTDVYESCALSTDGYLDEGIYKILGSDNQLQLLDIKSGAIILYVRSGNYLHISSFRNGKATVSYSKLNPNPVYYSGAVSDFKFDNENYPFSDFPSNHCQLHLNGATIQIKSAESEIEKRYSGQIFVTGNGYFVVETTDEKYIVLDEYYNEVYSSTAEIYVIAEDEKCLCLQLTNSSSRFLVLLDEHYKEISSPIPAYDGDLFIGQDRIVYASDESYDMWNGTYPVYHVLDLSTGKEVSVIDNVCRLAGSFSDGLAPGYIRRAAFDYPYFYINEQGEIVLDTLYE